jgi:hypothetical protein
MASAHETNSHDSAVMKHTRILTLARRRDDARRHTENAGPRLILASVPNVEASRAVNDVAGTRRDGTVRRLDAMRPASNETSPRGDPPTAA